MKPILDVRHLSINFKTRKGEYTVVQDVSFHVDRGEILGIAGESGCGKSVTSLSILGLLPDNGYLSAGEILFDERDLVKYPDLALCDIRGNEIAMIFQDPLSSLNPTMSIGDQLVEPYRIHKNYSKPQAEEAALEMLKKVGIPSPEKRMKEYPHQLSGGMRQRIMIAMALSCSPKLLIADEPTTALDVSIQAQILKLMQQLNQDSGTSIMLITHDMGVIAQMCDKVMIMYSGKAVEYAVDEDRSSRLAPLHAGPVDLDPQPGPGRGVAFDHRGQRALAGYHAGRLPVFAALSKVYGHLHATAAAHAEN